MSVKQTTHSPRMASHRGAVEGQSLFCRHCTHELEAVSQIGVIPLHCELLVHPLRHVKSCGLQIGCAEPQSEFERHCTHV